MTNLIALFSVRLTATNPAPAVLRAIAFYGSNKTELKKAYNIGLKALKKEMRQYKVFDRLAILEDMGSSIVVDGVLVANLLDTETTDM